MKLQTLRHFAADIKLSHTIFALPFAYAGLLLGNSPPLSLLLLGKFLLCMVTARSFAMGMNRWLDRHLDGQNPRTRGRAIPAHQLKASQVLFLSLLCGVAFIAFSFSFNLLTGWLSPLLLAILAGYSLMKRVSWLTHWYLGMCLGLAPVAANVAIQGRMPWPVCLLGLAILFWTAGFDILYASQDLEFDTRAGLHSIPARWGRAKAWWVSVGCFVTMISLLVAVGELTQRHTLYHVGVTLMGGLLAYEIWLVREMAQGKPPSRLNQAFFTVNGWVSLLFYGFVQLDYWYA